MLAIYRVHRRKVRHVLQEHPAANHLLHRRTRRLEDCRDVLQRTLGLHGNVALDHLSTGIHRRLAGDEYKTVGLDRLRIRADRLWGVWCGYRRTHASIVPWVQ